ncbi:MAG: phage major capsid protein [Clostridia bacterium]|nr:phage major capsid protein [Clostridia bacterium]
MAIIDRTGADILIPEENSREIVQLVPQYSTVMRQMRRLPDMGSRTRMIPVLSALPMSYFVDGDIGYKRTTAQAWENVKLYAEEIACIVPIPQAVLDDSDYDIWANVLPRLTEAIGATFDRAVLFGHNKPANFPEGLVPGAIRAGNVVMHDPAGSLYQEILGDGGVASLVEEDGFVPTGYIAHITMKGKLRGTVDGNGLPIFGRVTPQQQAMTTMPSMGELDSCPVIFPKTEIMDADTALLLGGDWSVPVWAIRTDITTKLLTEAVIQDPNTMQIVYNLAQQDMVALRCVFRAGWVLPNPVNRLNMDRESRYPFAVLTPPV